MRSYNNFIIDMDVLIKLSKFYIFFIYDKNRMKYKIHINLLKMIN